MFDAGRYIGRSICNPCRSDPTLYAKAKKAQQERLADERDEPMRARLEKDDNYRRLCPLGAEDVILRWQRGERLKDVEGA
jgi:hypothetical protein